MTHLNTVLLIDDNPGDNFYHRIIIEETGLVGRIEEQLTGPRALAFLRKTELVIDLILLDINLPGMNGFEFLEAYEEFARDWRCQPALVVLTTSLNPADEDKVARFPQVCMYANKPLDADGFRAIVKRCVKQG